LSSRATHSFIEVKKHQNDTNKKDGKRETNALDKVGHRKLHEPEDPTQECRTINNGGATGETRPRGKVK